MQEAGCSITQLPPVLSSGLPEKHPNEAKIVG